MLAVILVSNSFTSNLELLAAQPWLFALFHRRATTTKKVSCDVCAALATPADLVYDVADTECWTQMAAPTVVFSRLSNVHIKQAGREIE